MVNIGEESLAAPWALQATPLQARRHRVLCGCGYAALRPSVRVFLSGSVAGSRLAFPEPITAAGIFPARFDPRYENQGI